MSDLTTQVSAIRHGVALSRHDNLSLFRFAADAGLAIIDPLVATNLDIRESQFRQALRLDGLGRPIADLLIGFFGGTLHVFGDGLPTDELVATLNAETATRAHETHAIFGVDGPFAWELIGAWDTTQAIGLPYLGAYSPRDGVLVIRSGKTGEYGYLIAVPNDQADTVWAELQAASGDLQCKVVGSEALRHCSLENLVFEIDREGRFDLDALELQLTWRLDLRKQAAGLDAIRAHREAGLRRRLTAVETGADVAVGDEIRCDGRRIGSVLAWAPDLSGGLRRVLSVLDMPFGESGMTYTLNGQDARTLSAPFVLNHSLFLNPQRHGWSNRDEVELPEGLAWPTSTP